MKATWASPSSCRFPGHRVDADLGPHGHVLGQPGGEDIDLAAQTMKVRESKERSRRLGVFGGGVATARRWLVARTAITGGGGAATGGSVAVAAVLIEEEGAATWGVERQSTPALAACALTREPPGSSSIAPSLTSKLAGSPLSTPRATASRRPWSSRLKPSPTTSPRGEVPSSSNHRTAMELAGQWDVVARCGCLCRRRKAGTPCAKLFAQSLAIPPQDDLPAMDLNRLDAQPCRDAHL